MEMINAINTISSDKTSAEYIAVNNCGFYHVTDIDIKTCRPNGRTDYQLIHLKSGEGEYIINGVRHRLHQGDVLLYKPHEEQIYTIFSEYNSEMYWIHFTGTGIEKMLKSSGIWDKGCVNTGKSTLFFENIRKIMHQIQLKQSGYELFCNAYLTEIIAELAQYGAITDGTAAPVKYQKLMPAIEKMNGCLSDMSTVDEYARMCCIDRYYFMALFKEYTGTSPIHRRTEIKMNAACRLLSDTSMNVGEIAQTLGFKDSLYFSRIFKKHTGVSPCAFRKSSVQNSELI